jgi:benzoyl-CoA reductase/2-hydroxyglutaryl-CoA dehydratase subunit BcrC/BadD/HgdB
MKRKEYLIEQKEKGRRLLGVFPAQYPKEILWAMNVLPAEIWDPPLEITLASAHLQTYICSVVKLGMELVLQGKCDFLDGFLFPHTCDSIQNMASVIYDYVRADKPCYFFYHPKAPFGNSAREYYLNHLKELVRSLEKQFGRLDLEELRQQIRQGQRISSLFHELYNLRARGKLLAGNELFYHVVRLGEYLFPDDLIPELEGFLARNKGQKKETKKPAVILSGVLPNPTEILRILDDLEVRVAHDDLLVGSRRLLIPQNDIDDPFESLTESYFALPPCSTKGASIIERLEHLLRLIEETDAKGVVFNMLKFCEPEWFDVPNLREELRRKKIPVLVLDTDLNQALSGQMKTRLEAFIEIIT